MRIFYGHSAGRPEVAADFAVEASLETALAVLHSLETSRGFLGVILDDCSTLQLLSQRKGMRIELLNTSRPAFDSCLAEVGFAEALLRAAAAGRDVFSVARQERSDWEHTDLA